MSRIWLIGALAGVLAVLATALGIALTTGRGAVGLLPADSPEGVVQRYLLALEREDFREAYGYLSRELRTRCSLDEFVTRAPGRGMRGDHVTLEKVQALDGGALVRARVTVFDPDRPFGDVEHSYGRTFRLTLEGSQWRLVEPEWWCPRSLGASR